MHGENPFQRQLRLYTGLMTNSTSYLLLVDFLFIEIGENQSEEVDLQARRPANSCTGKSSTSSSSRIYLRIGLVESSACASTWPLHHFLEGQLSIGILCYLYVFVSFSGTEYSVRFCHLYT